MTVDLSDYVEVSERIAQFYSKHPAGSLQGDGEFVRDEQGRIYGYVYRAYAYREPEDMRPGVGTAFEPIPGRTPYTRDSEVMNAETSAWGRAIVACGFSSRHIASANEVRARQDSGGSEAGAAAAPTSSSPENPAAQAQAAFEASRAIPQDDGAPENVALTFGKHKGKTLAEVDAGYLKWLVENYEPKTADQRRLVAAAQMLVGGGAAAPFPDDDIPF